VLCHIKRLHTCTGQAKKRDHFVLQLVTLEILIRSAPNLALTLIRYLFETTLENSGAIYRMTITFEKRLQVFSRRSCFAMRRTDDREMPVRLSVS